MMNICKWLFRVLVAALALSSYGLGNTASQTPSEHVVSSLSNHRIVMLGDFAHEFPLTNHTLLSVLETWVTKYEDGQSDVSRLTLFIEEDEQLVALLRTYLRGGKLDSLFEHVLPGTSIERFELYADLRRIVERIDSINGVSSQARKIVFDVRGAETMVTNSGIMDSSGRATLLFYVKERDSLSAWNIVTYLRANPDKKGLIFYGDGHLIKNVVEKKEFTRSLNQSERTGAYIGYYLKKEFGQDSVLTINQVALERSRLKFTEADSADHFYLGSDVPWKGLPQNYEALVPDNMDAFIVLHGFVLQNHPWSYVLSRRIGTAAIRRLEETQGHRGGVFGERLYQQAIRTLRFLYDTTFSSAEEWKQMAKMHTIDGMKQLTSLWYHDYLLGEGTATVGTPKLGTFIDKLINMGWDTRIGAPGMTVEEWTADFEKMWPQIVALNAIGIYWSGDDIERADAKVYLIQKSGRTFEDPALYLKWWRKRFFRSEF